MKKSFSLLTVLLILLIGLPVSVNAGIQLGLNIPKQKVRQFAGGIVPPTVMFPKGELLIAYIPYRAEIFIPNEGVFQVILVKKIQTRYELKFNMHEIASVVIANARKKVWEKWYKFKQALLYNKIRITKEMEKSYGNVYEIERRGLWQNPIDSVEPTKWKIPKQVKRINQVTKYNEFTMKSEIKYHAGYIPSGLVEVESIWRFNRLNFGTLFDVQGQNNKDLNGIVYWQFVTSYIRKYAILLEEIDWANPPSDDEKEEKEHLLPFPPANFSIKSEKI